MTKTIYRVFVYTKYGASAQCAILLNRIYLHAAAAPVCRLKRLESSITDRRVRARVIPERNWFTWIVNSKTAERERDYEENVNPRFREDFGLNGAWSTSAVECALLFVCCNNIQFQYCKRKKIPFQKTTIRIEKKKKLFPW